MKIIFFSLGKKGKFDLKQTLVSFLIQFCEVCGVMIIHKED
jgi:hypothetical protein